MIKQLTIFDFENKEKYYVVRLRGKKGVDCYLYQYGIMKNIVYTGVFRICDKFKNKEEAENIAKKLQEHEFNGNWVKNHVPHIIECIEVFEGDEHKYEYKSKYIDDVEEDEEDDYF